MFYILGYVLGIWLAYILITIIEIIIYSIKSRQLDKKNEEEAEKILNLWKEKYPVWYEKTFEKD